MCSEEVVKVWWTINAQPIIFTHAQPHPYAQASPAPMLIIVLYMQKLLLEVNWERR